MAPLSEALLDKMSRSSSQETIDSNGSGYGTGDSASALPDLPHTAGATTSHQHRPPPRHHRRPERRSKSYDCIMQHAQQLGGAEEEPRLLPQGMLFGIDIGGTLAKIVFREPSLRDQRRVSSTMSDQIGRLNKYFMSPDLFPSHATDTAHDTSHDVPRTKQDDQQHTLSSTPAMTSKETHHTPDTPHTTSLPTPHQPAAATAGAGSDEGEGETETETDSQRHGGAEDESLFIKDSDYGGVFGGNLRFRRLETSQIDLLFNVLRHERAMNPHEVTQWKIFATGGGSFKYETRFKDMGIRVRKSDEMETIVSGVLFAIDNIPDECFTWVPAQDSAHQQHTSSSAPAAGARRHSTQQARPTPKLSDKDLVYKTIAVGTHQKPWLVVNVGSGVSMLKLDQQMTVELPLGKVGTYKRVGGTPLGGGTFLALGCLLTGAKSHKELLELAEEGDANKVDKLVGDIYGEDYSGLGLSADTVASSFGKLVNSDLREKVTNQDLAASLVQMISWNIAHIARLVASQEGARTIIFTGSFMHENGVSQRKFASAFRYWSKGDSQALFMRHEGYVGALGALAMSTLVREDPR